ncbi:MAG: (2Fe-2S)-binding protein [Porticoccus sp.]|nr:(2Fe-2S)-binding protein [Porticoccus sp.]
MYVCNCKGITDHDIRVAASDGVTNLRSLRKCTGATSQCGKCTPHVKAVLNEALKEINCYDVMSASYT